MLKTLRARASYLIDNLFARGSLAQFGLVLLLALATLAFGMTAYFFGLFAPENAEVEGIVRKHDDGGLLDTLWWSVQLLFDPTAFYAIQGATWPILLVALVMTVLGMTVFATLIGFTSSAIDTRLEELRKGHSRVFEQQHVLILGWNSLAVPILEFLSQEQRRVKVVILAPRDIDEMSDALRRAGIFERKMRLILRSGAPSSLAELQRVAFESARSIIVLAHTDAEHSEADPDIEVIKTLMLLSSFDGWKKAVPKMVSEIRQKEKLEIARIAGGHRIPIVSSSQIVSKVVVQCSRQAHLSAVYERLFAFAGEGVHIRAFPQCAGMRFGDALHAFADAVLLGVSRRQERAGHWHYVPVLNPGDDYRIAEDEWLILLCHDVPVMCDVAARQPSVVHPDALTHDRVLPERILILGWNSNIYDILAEYNEYVLDGTCIDIVSAYDESDAWERLGELGAADFQNLRIGFHHGNTLLRSGLAAMKPAGYDSIMVLADTSHDEADPDARTIMSLILLQDILAPVEAESRPSLVGEILDPANRELVARTGVNDIIVSPEIVSMLLTQVSQQQMLIAVYDALLSSHGSEIYLKPAVRYLPAGRSLSFGELTALVQAHQEVALGVLHHPATGKSLIRLNPGKAELLTLGEADQIIVLAAHLYQPGEATSGR